MEYLQILKDFISYFFHYCFEEWDVLLYKSWVVLGAFYMVLALTWGFLIIYDYYKEKGEKENG